MFNRIRTVRKRWLIVFTAVALLAVGLVSGGAFAAARSDYIANSLREGDDYGYGQSRRGHGDSAALMTRVASMKLIAYSACSSSPVATARMFGSKMMSSGATPACSVSSR